MSNRSQHLDQLDNLLRGNDGWQYERQSNTWRADVGDFTLKVQHREAHNEEERRVLEQHNVNAEWSVLRNGQEEMQPTPAVTVKSAKKDAVEFARALLLGKYEEQHAE